MAILGHERAGRFNPRGKREPYPDEWRGDSDAQKDENVGESVGRLCQAIRRVRP